MPKNTEDIIIENNIKKTAIDQFKQEIIDELENKLELHKHNSIPNYNDELEEGCITCVANNAFMRAIEIIKSK